MKTRDIMSREVITAFTDTSIEELAKILTENNISGVPIVGKDNKVVGIVTEKDIMYKDVEPRFPPVAEILGGLIYIGGVKEYNSQLKKFVATSAKEIMTKDVITVSDDDDIKEVAALMVEHNINRVPVLDSEEKLCGIISRADIVKFIAKTL